MQKFGIDISRHNGDFDFARAKKEGVEFVILKGAGGDAGLYTDAKFAENYSTCKALGLPVGAYFYSLALSVEEAEEEAEYFIEHCLKGRQLELPVYYDVEESAMFALGRKKLTDIIDAWCSALEKAGFMAGIYSTAYVFETYTDDSRLKKYTHWVASWTKTCLYTDKSVLGMWQFGGETNELRSVYVAGAVCDQNYLYVDFETVAKTGGLNGFPAAKPEEPGKDAETGGTDVYFVQLGSFTDKAGAQTLADELRAKGYEAVIAKQGDFDLDGTVTAADARSTLRRSVGLKE